MTPSLDNLLDGVMLALDRGQIPLPPPGVDASARLGAPVPRQRWANAQAVLRFLEDSRCRE